MRVLLLLSWRKNWFALPVSLRALGFRADSLAIAGFGPDVAHYFQVAAQLCPLEESAGPIDTRDVTSFDTIRGGGQTVADRVMDLRPSLRISDAVDTRRKEAHPDIGAVRNVSRGHGSAVRRGLRPFRLRDQLIFPQLADHPRQ